jgi:CHAT domain-containing protein
MPEFAQPNWGDLPHVRSEVEAISALVPSEVLLNQSFEIPQLETQVSRLPFPVVHLATHGKFSSDLSETFVLTWDGELDAEQLSKLLQSSELTRDGAVELLILSACETATGDDRAALGLAGVAVRSGARSTLATLWLVDDAATADLMVDVYRTLSETSLTKAQVVQQVQKNFLQDDERKHPYYWAPFVLVGNWL